MSGEGGGPRERPVPSRGVLFAAAALLLAGLGFASFRLVQRHAEGLDEDRSVYAALATARAAARLTEAGQGTVTPHLVAYGNAVGMEAPTVRRLLVLEQGRADAFGVRRGAQVLWSMHGATGDVTAVDFAVADRMNAVGAAFDPKRRVEPLRLDLLVELTTMPGGGRTLAAYAPVVAADGSMRGLAAALVDTTPSPAFPLTALLPTAVGLLVLALGATLRRLRAGGVVVAAAAAFILTGALALPVTIQGLERAYVAGLADDWLTVQAHADAHAPVALAAPVADREPWTLDGALRLEREPSDDAPSALLTGASRVGRGAASVALHPDLAAEIDSGHRLPLTGLVAFGALLLLLLSFPLARLATALRREPGTYAYLAPAFVGMLVLVIAPFATGVGLAFYRYHLEGNAYEFVGLGNFAEILAPDPAADTHFWRTLAVTLLWTATNVVLHVSLGLALALVLNRPVLRGRGLYRVLLILPWAVPSYITALIWRAMFLGNDGPINTLLGLAGVGPVSFFDDRFLTNFIPNLVTNTWLGFPFMMVVCLGALQSIPKELYEAAALDGASPWQRFRHVTLPLLQPALLPAVILGTIWTFNLFNVIYLVSMGSGDTDILVVAAYRAFREQHRYGFAAAYSVLIFGLLFAYTTVSNRISKAAEGAMG